eukprot:9474889-Pyramimonas_sp.AAC.1
MPLRRRAPRGVRHVRRRDATSHAAAQRSLRGRAATTWPRKARPPTCATAAAYHVLPHQCTARA